MVRTWAKLIWNCVGVALVAAAAQLGIAEALGIIRWNARFDAAGGAPWTYLLTWVAFIYAVAVLAGAAIGRGAMRRPGRPEGALARIIAGLAAAVGATAAITLAWLPAHDAVPPVHVHPELVVAAAGAAGAVVGLMLALAALFLGPFAGAARAAVGWIWLLAIGSAAAGVASHRAYAPPRLGMLDAPSLVPAAWWSGTYLLIAISTVAAIVVAVAARWGGSHRLAVALSGLVGPAILAAAYLIPGPATGAREILTAALYAAGAGVLATTLIALPGRRNGAARDDHTDVSPSGWAYQDRYDEPADTYRYGSDSTDEFTGGFPAPTYSGGVYRGETYRTETVRAGLHRAAEAEAGHTYPGLEAAAEPATYRARSGRDLDYPTDEYPTASTRT